MQLDERNGVWAHGISEHLVYVCVHGYASVIQQLLPAIPRTEKEECVVDEL